MSEPKTLAEQLDAAKSGAEFASVIDSLFKTAERLKDSE